MTSKTTIPDGLNYHLKKVNLVCVSSKALFPMSPLTLGFKAGKWINDDSLVEDYVMCSICGDWLHAPTNQGTNVLKRHIKKCSFNGYALLDAESLAKLVSNCLKLGGLNIDTHDLKNSFENYPVITKDIM